MFSRHHPSIAITLLLVVSFLLPISSIPSAGLNDFGKEMGAMAGPTRTIVDETESNNQWTTADQLPSSYGRYELHGNLSATDNDLFYVQLNGGNGPTVDRITISKGYIDTNYWYDIVFVIIYAFYPDDNLAGNNYDANLVHLRYWDQDGLFNTGDVLADASYSGLYGIAVQAQNGTNPAYPISGTIAYNLTISISSESPADSNNDEDQPQQLTLPHSESIDQNQDLMDWYEISAPNPIHPTDVDMTLSFSNPTPNDSGGSTNYGIEVDLYIRYNSRTYPDQFTEEIIKVSPNPTFQSAGLKAAPYNLKINKNCTKIIIGMVMQTYGLDAKSPNLNNKQYTSVDGNSAYSITGSITADIPNNRPILRNGAVVPKSGRSNEMFNFSVRYFDVNNQTPEQIWLWKDGSPFRELSPINGSGQDNTLGVDYGISLPGSLIGKDKAHTMNFSAYDGEDWATQEPTGLGSFVVIIDDNLPPSSSVGDTYLIEMEEDDETYEVEIGPLFTDPDPLTQFEFNILNTKGEWSKTYSDSDLAAVITKASPQGPYVLRVTPKKDRHGTFHLTLNATDSGTFSKSVLLDVIVKVTDINDPPVIKRVGTRSINEGTVYLTLDAEQNENITLDILAEDIDQNDVLYFDWDLPEVMSHPVPGINYWINHSSGEMWMIPGDGDVPEMILNLKVNDGRGGKAEIDVVINVENRNDRPIISVPALRTTIEGEYLYITPSVFDPDLDDGDQLYFSYDIGPLSQASPPNAIEFDPLSGRLVIKAISEKMNGEWEVNITVSDLSLGSDWGICKIIIENINDAPICENIYPEVEDGNLTVRFTTGEASDEDGDPLNYIWDFGDGTDPVEGRDQRIIEHTYPTGGSYTATLLVSDGGSFSEEVTAFLTVTGPDPDPDMDDDKMDDSWERLYGLDPSDPSDAEEDPDKDGLTNLEEFTFFKDLGKKLNPRNPDSDEDGWKDGEEVDSSFDPMDPGDHPQGKYTDLPQILFILALLIMVLAVLFTLVFLVMKKRNKPIGVAVAVPSYTQTGYQMMPPGIEQYPSIPPARMEALPPANQGQEDYSTIGSGGSDTVGLVDGQNIQGGERLDQNPTGIWQEPPVSVSEVQIPFYQPPAMDVQEAPSQEGGFPGFDAPIPKEGSLDTVKMGSEPVLEEDSEHSMDNGVVPQTLDPEIEKENPPPEDQRSSIPPPPSLPEDL